ncbi:Ankyrin Repeat Domain-Containing Protein 12 [Manis pentadactyla]|nr:Ankyrin Repeat Domain-Containing Protein 12 [Manis pentadactyla]
MTDVEADGFGSVYGVYPDTVRFAFYSDVREKVRLVYIIVTLKLIVSSQETSMLTLRFHVKGARMTKVGADGNCSGYGLDQDTVRFTYYSDVSTKARLIFIIVVWQGVRVKWTGLELGIVFCEVYRKYRVDIIADAEGPG